MMGSWSDGGRNGDTNRRKGRSATRSTVLIAAITATIMQAPRTTRDHDLQSGGGGHPQRTATWL
jgi:hypothetical protein